jgi:site-specific DNA-cytosine methylase
VVLFESGVTIGAVKADPRPVKRECRRGTCTHPKCVMRVPPAVTSSDGAGKVKQVRYTLAEACRLQGLPENYLADAPFTAEGKLKAVANGVPLPMGRAIARAVSRAMQREGVAS